MVRILCLGVTLLIMVGCSVGVRSLESVGSTPTVNTPTPTFTPTPTKPYASTPDTPTPILTPTPTLSLDGAPEGTWIYPAKVEIGNLYPGARAESTVRVHNGGNKAAVFRIYYENLAKPSGEYEPAPAQAKYWVAISPTLMLIDADETRDVKVKIVLPDEAEIPMDKFGFLIVSEEDEQYGNVRIRHAAKWLVDMR